MPTPDYRPSGARTLLSPGRLAGLEILLAPALLITGFLLLSSPHPYDYDSISYAIGIADKYDIRLKQPHAFGYLYHILLGRIFLPLARNSFRVQSLLNLLYLFATLAMIPFWKDHRGKITLIIASLPLSIFLVALPVSHGACMAGGALIAALAYRVMEQGKHPVIAAVGLGIAAGFRQDLIVFLGPLVCFLHVWRRVPIRNWVVSVGIGAVLTALWYVPTGILSDGASPWVLARQDVASFLSASSILYGASVAQWLRSTLRFLLYAPAILGPGGILALVLMLRRCDTCDKRVLLIATLPFFCYGTMLYLGHPTYYATIIGFWFVWLALRNRAALSRRTALICACLNLIWFLLLPAPQTGDGRTFSDRTPIENAGKQLSYLGATSLSVIRSSREFPRFLDSTLGRCESIADVDWTGLNGVGYPRAWQHLSSHRWRNRFVSSSCSADCVIGFVNERFEPSARFGGIGVWSRSDKGFPCISHDPGVGHGK